MAVSREVGKISEYYVPSQHLMYCYAILGSIMEDICNRFPHIATTILKDLDDQSLIKSMEANRELNNFLSNNRIYWTRVLAIYNTNFTLFKRAWRRCLHQVPVVKIKELVIAAHNFFKNQSSFNNKQWSPLHIAANNGNLDFYKYIARKCGCINHVRDDGIAAIHMAASEGHLEIVKFIIDNLQDKNKNPGATDPDGLTPLHLAALKGHFETCKFIMNLLTNKNPRTKNGWTPLHCVAEGGNTKIYKLLMENLVEKNPGCNAGCTPLHVASIFGNLEIIELIMCQVQDKNPESTNGTTPLHVAVSMGNLEVVKLFVEHPKVQILGDVSYTLLHSAARYGNFALCKLLIENSNNKNYVDRAGATPLHYAAINGHFAICDLLFPYFRDKCHFNNVWTLGHFAMKNGDSRYWEEIGKGLKSVGPKTNDGVTFLQLMALNFDVMKTM